MGHKVAVTEALQVAQERRHTAINDHLIEDNLLVQMSVVVCMASKHFHMLQTCQTVESVMFRCACQADVIDPPVDKLAARYRDNQTKHAGV